MRRVATLARHPRKRSRMTGLALDQLQTLRTPLIPRWAGAERERLSRHKRSTVKIQMTVHRRIGRWIEATTGRQRTLQP